jgi:hypothetical protein
MWGAMQGALCKKRPAWRNERFPRVFAMQGAFRPTWSFPHVFSMQGAGAKRPAWCFSWKSSM